MGFGGFTRLSFFGSHRPLSGAVFAHRRPEPAALTHAAPDLADAIKKLARASVLVVGDVMLDRYVFGDVSRISPEAPVPVLAVERDLALPGGAGNVVRNLTSLGAAVAFVSVVGDDQAGSDLTGLIGGQPNVEPWLLVQGGRCTTVKTRFIARGQQLLRSDQEQTGAIHPKLAERLFRIVTDAQAATSVTVLSDYAKGVLAGDVAPRIIAAAQDLGRPTVVAPRGADFDRFTGADVVVSSQRELAAVTGMDVGTPSRVVAAARWLRTAYGFGAIVVNRGAQGLSVIMADAAHHVPYAASEIFDFSGAADTAVSALAAGLAVGLDLLTAARVAALAMGVAAGRPGMAVARGTDLLAMLTPQGRALRKIVGPDIAMQQVASWRSAGLRTGFLATPPAQLDRARLDAARAGCDRLVLGVEAISESDEPPPALAEAAAWPAVDLLCLFADGTDIDIIERLRPELVIHPTPSAALAQTVRAWGGEMVAG